MSALNLIIARGFPEMASAFQDGRNEQRNANEVSRANQVNTRNAEQDQQFHIDDRQAGAAQDQELQGLMQAAQQLAAAPDQNAPEVQAGWRQIVLESERIKQGSSSAMRSMLAQNPQEGSGFGNVNPGDYTPESLARYAQTRNFSDLVRQYAPPGQVLVNTPGFGVGLVDKGNPGNRTMLTTPEEEAAAKAAAAAATAGAKEGAKSSAAAVSDLPRVKESSRQIRGLLDQLSNPDALKWVYGPASVAPVVPGTPQADAVGLWEQINGQAFMQAFTSLKGGGQITEKEGEKATVAITRLSNRKISTKAAQAAINELRDITQRAEANAEKRATTQPASGGEINFADLPD